MANDHNSPLGSSYSHLRAIPVPMQALVEAGLNPSQWVVLYLMHFKLWEELHAYQTGPDAPQGFPDEDLDDLHARFYIIHEPVPGEHHKLSPMNFRVSERFTDLLSTVKAAYIPTELAIANLPPTPTRKADITKPVIPGMGLDGLEAFDELFAAYPSHIPVQGTLMSGRSGDYDSMADVYSKYLSRKYSVEHRDILDILVWAKENELIKMGLAKFISGREWLGLQELRDSGFNGQGYSNQDAI